MQKFSEYVNNDKTNSKSNQTNQGGMNESAFELLKRVASQYEGASQEQLLGAIMNEAKLAKQRGTLSSQEIQNFVLTISPMLSSSQRSQLEKIVEQITNS